MKLEIKNVEKKFNSNYVLNDINLTMENGKIYGFVGRNGSGKTVLLKLICGFYKPTDGEILLDGYNYIKNNEYPKNTGALIENPSFLPYLSGYDNLKLLADINKKIKKEDIDNILKLVNLYDDRNKIVFKYSLGMKQKLGIAQAIMENQDLIILDEPFNGVEKESASKIRDYLKTIKENKIIIISTHVSEDLDNFVDVVYKIEDGRIVNE